MISCKFCESFKHTFLTECLRMTASYVYFWILRSFSEQFLYRKPWKTAYFLYKLQHLSLHMDTFFDWAKIFKKIFKTFVIISLNFWNNQWSSRKNFFIVSVLGLHTWSSKIRSTNLKLKLPFHPFIDAWKTKNSVEEYWLLVTNHINNAVDKY